MSGDAPNEDPEETNDFGRFSPGCNGVDELTMAELIGPLSRGDLIMWAQLKEKFPAEDWSEKRFRTLCMPAHPITEEERREDEIKALKDELCAVTSMNERLKFILIIAAIFAIYWLWDYVIAPRFNPEWYETCIVRGEDLPGYCSEPNTGP